MVSAHPALAAHDDDRSLGERVADHVAAFVGSWPFVIGQSIILAAWVAGNAWLLSHPFDPRPFILLNLCLSFQAAYTGPIVLLSQNRQAAKDRDLAAHDFAVNQDALAKIERLVELQEARA